MTQIILRPQLSLAFIIALILFTFAATPAASYAQTTSDSTTTVAPRDVLYLKDGKVIRGILKEMSPEKGIVFQTTDGSVLVYSLAEVSRLTKASEDISLSGDGTTTNEPEAVFTVGLLTGGSLIGLDIEFLTTEKIGIQIGGGLLGIAGALNYHFKPGRYGGYVSATVKGVGLSYLVTAGAEYGYRFKLGESIGLGFAIGVGAIVNKSARAVADQPDLKDLPAILTYSVGLVF
jgi:hypothetical protein